jgi:hypothetical protein
MRLFLYVVYNALFNNVLSRLMTIPWPKHAVRFYLFPSWEITLFMWRFSVLCYSVTIIHNQDANFKTTNWTEFSLRRHSASQIPHIFWTQGFIVFLKRARHCRLSCTTWDRLKHSYVFYLFCFNTLLQSSTISLSNEQYGLWNTRYPLCMMWLLVTVFIVLIPLNEVLEK